MSACHISSLWVQAVVGCRRTLVGHRPLTLRAKGEEPTRQAMPGFCTIMPVITSRRVTAPKGRAGSV